MFSDTTMCGALLIRGKAADFMARLGVIYSRSMFFNLGAKVADLALIQYPKSDILALYVDKH